MNKLWFLGLAVVWLAPQGAQAATLEELEALIQQQQEQIEALTEEVNALKSDRAQEAPRASTADEGRSWSSQSESFAARGEFPGFGGVHTKPFLRNYGGRVHIGGYADIEYKDSQDANAEFDQHRLIPFIYADVTDRVKFATEIELEHGGPDSSGGGAVKVEFATIDYLFSDAVNFRAGIVLSPLGKLNAVHDSPLQDLTDRPMVNRFIVPTTLSEAGAGFFGSFTPGETSQLDYEVYLVNGFNGTSDGTVNISRTSGLRSARGSTNGDNNDNPAVVGRLGYSPFLGLEIGVSEHLGHYDERGSSLLSITAFDVTAQRGPFEFLAEAAYASIGHDAYTKAVGVPDDMYGYYTQANYHFMPGFLRSWAPKVFSDESTFTFVNRWGQVNLDGNRSQRYTVGLNFRPTEETVFKSEFQFNQESGLLDSFDNNALVFSAATFF